MKHAALLSLIALAGMFAQSKRSESPQDIRLPNGKVWADEIARADHERNIKDAEKLVQLSTEIRDEFVGGEKFVLSVKTLQKVEDAEKLLKDLRTRMRRN